MRRVAEQAASRCVLFPSRRRRPPLHPSQLCRATGRKESVTEAVKEQFIDIIVRLRDLVRLVLNLRTCFPTCALCLTLRALTTDLACRPPPARS